VPPVAGIVAACLAILLVAVVSAVVVSGLRDKVYGARVDILYLVARETPDDARERILSTQEALIHSRAVLGPVARRNGVALDELEGAVSVDAGLNDLLRLTVADKDRDRALMLARDVTSQYLRVSSALSPEATRGRDLLQREIGRLTVRARSASGEERQILSERIGRLQDRIVDLEVEDLAVPRAQVLSPAYALEDPLSPDPTRAAIGGLLVGLVVATGAAVLMFRRRQASPFAR
jgi:uncharacterized protein involved in exopolysaccharide biosynthesis